MKTTFLNPKEKNDNNQSSQGSSKNATKNAVAGGVSAGILAGSAFALMGFANPSSADIDTEAASNTEPANPANVLNLTPATHVSDSQSFNEAFVSARQECGANGVFTWHGKQFNTLYKEEIESLPANTRIQVQQNTDNYASHTTHQSQHDNQQQHTTNATPAPTENNNDFDFAGAKLVEEKLTTLDGKEVRIKIYIKDGVVAGKIDLGNDGTTDLIAIQKPDGMIDILDTEGNLVQSVPANSLLTENDNNAAAHTTQETNAGNSGQGDDADQGDNQSFPAEQESVQEQPDAFGNNNNSFGSDFDGGADVSEWAN
jgi:hypothetical protein